MTTQILLQTDLAARLRVATARLVRVTREAGGAIEVTRGQESAMRVISRKAPITTAELAEREQVRPQSMGEIVRSLVTLELVAKTPDPGDGRRELLALTARGQDILETVSARRNAVLAALLEERLEPAERAVLADALPLLERLVEPQ